MRLNQGGCDNSEGPGVGQRGRQRIPLLVLGWAVELPPRVGSPLQLSSERPLSPPPKANSTWHFASPLEPAPRPTAEKKKQDEGQCQGSMGWSPRPELPALGNET